MRERYVDVRLEVEPGQERAALEPEPERPFAMAILGDFSGRSGRSTDRDSIRDLGAIRVDRDDFDDVLARVAPSLLLTLPHSDAPLGLRFRDIDDFHPDRLYDALALFGSLRELRARLANPSSFRQAAAELLADPAPGDAPGDAPAATAASAPAGREAPQNGSSVLDLILADQPDSPTTSAPVRETDATDGLQAFLRRIVAPHRLPGEDPRQSELIEEVDLAVGSQMRNILHHPAFRDLEALWRSVFLLTRQLETDSMLRLYLVDVTRDELRDDLSETNAAVESGFGDLLDKGAEPGVPWSVVVGQYTFGGDPRDVELLARIAEVARDARAPFLAAAAPELVGVGSGDGTPAGIEPAAVALGDLRHDPAASYLGLAHPRFLLRLPYGADSDECERFAFEEMPSDDSPGEYLWGNSAIVIGLLIAQAFTRSGWEMRPGAVKEVDGLPLHVVRGEGDTSTLPCTEVVLTDAEVDAVLEAGVMALVPVRDRGAVRLVQARSIAEPAGALRGPWDGV